MTSELDKFTTCDLLKTFDKISEHLSKAAPDKMKEITAKYGGADMAKKEVAKEAKDYDPNEKTPKADVEETKKPGETSVSEDKNAKVEKDGGYPSVGGGGDETSPGTQADVLTQILEAIQDLKAMLAQMAGQERQEPEHQGQPDEMKMGSEKTEEEKEKDKEKGEVEKDAVPSVPSEKQIASIVVKALEDKFKEFGITKTIKPSEDSGHPIEKAESIDMTKLARMSWNDVNAYNDKTRPKSFYERAYGQ